MVDLEIELQSRLRFQRKALQLKIIIGKMFGNAGVVEAAHDRVEGVDRLGQHHPSAAAVGAQDDHGGAGGGLQY